jgi:hypothetical protein
MGGMRIALLAIALVLGFAASAGRDGAPAGGAEARAGGDALGSDGAAAVGGRQSDGAAAVSDRRSHGGGAARPDGLLVIAALSPERAIVADPLTGRTRERVFPGGTLCHGELLAVGDRFLFMGMRGGELVPRTAPLAAPERARTLAAAGTVTPAVTQGHLWLGKRRGTSLELREVDLQGVEHARTTLPFGRWGGILAHVGQEFLTRDANGLVLGDERFPGAFLVAAQGNRFAWCDDPCPRVGLWHNGDRSELTPPAGVLVQVSRPAAFSPDGSRLALSVTVRGRPRYAVVELASGAWSIVPDARPGDYAALAWSPSGAWLYVNSGDRIAASRAGRERVTPLPIRTRDTVMSIATASRPGSAAP